MLERLKFLFPFSIFVRDGGKGFKTYRSTRATVAAIVSPHPAKYLSLTCPLLCMAAAYIQVHFRLDLIMDANTMIPDWTASLV